MVARVLFDHSTTLWVMHFLRCPPSSTIYFLRLLSPTFEDAPLLLDFPEPPRSHMSSRHRTTEPGRSVGKHGAARAPSLAATRNGHRVGPGRRGTERT